MPSHLSCLCKTLAWCPRWTWDWGPLCPSGDGMSGQQSWVMPRYPYPPQLCLPIVCLPFFCPPAKPCSICPHSCRQRGVREMNPVRLSEEAPSIFSLPLLCSSPLSCFSPFPFHSASQCIWALISVVSVDEKRTLKTFCLILITSIVWLEFHVNKTSESPQ